MPAGKLVIPAGISPISNGDNDTTSPEICKEIGVILYYLLTVALRGLFLKLLHVTNPLYKKGIFVQIRWTRCNKTNNFHAVNIML